MLRFHQRKRVALGADWVHSVCPGWPGVPTRLMLVPQQVLNKLNIEPKWESLVILWH